MSIFELNFSTRGINIVVKFNIFKRHLFAFIRHMTFKKLINFVQAEFNRLLKKDFVSSYPYLLKIESTNICNLKCAYCYNNRRKPLDGERPYGRMTFLQFKQLVDEVGQFVFKINLYGYGEPLLFPESLDMVEYATKKNIGVAISSNMNYKDHDLAEKIVRSGLEVLIFSCHGVSQESYSKFMGNGDQELAMKNIKSVIDEKKRLKSSTPFVDWQYCVTGFNEHEIELARDKAKELGIDQIRFIRANIPDDNASNEWFSTMFPKDNEVSKNVPESQGCSWLYRSAYINYDGGLLPCCGNVRPIKNDFGNVFRDGFKTIWNNEKYLSSRMIVASPKDKSIKCDTVCSHCWVTGDYEGLPYKN
ncbi:MAG: radical SAM protein [Deltaproteobacteria bacterium]|nr:radical SAM protein [Deltaproteobacteria bacterium]